MDIDDTGQDVHMPRGVAQPAIERFWAKVHVIDDDDSCWLWTAGGSNGYGRFGITSVNVVGAHVYAYVLTHGTVPDGLNVLHRCNVKLCVRPSHLYAGTQHDNGVDAIRAGLITNAVLTRQQADSIRALYSTGGYTQIQLAEMYSVSQSTISNILTARYWAWGDA
jgi:hypothetical protein